MSEKDLPPRMKQTLELRNQGLKYKEIAKIMGITIWGVARHLYFARYPEKYRENIYRQVDRERQAKKSKFPVYLRGFGVEGSYKRNSLLVRILRESGKHLQKLYFDSRKERNAFLKSLLKPYVKWIHNGEKHIITSWLKDQFLSQREIDKLYKEMGA